MNRFILLLFISLFSYAGSMAANDTKPMSCNHKVAMSEDLLAKVLKHRDSAFKTCLTCNKGDCSMKIWNEENKSNEMICKRMFCTPIKVAKAYEVPGNSPTGKSSFDYMYSISKKGKLTDINILKVEGEFNRKDALNYLKALTKRTKYEPLVNENKKYKITNLKSSMSVNMLWEDD
jgi:hypothetical protein|tara:strand:- start:540 stop:1067 length:528 start_codon:yes stop_codon:yes gene_type:complete